MMKPVVQAVVDLDSFALIDTARLEWIKFESKGPAFVAEEFVRWRDPAHVRLHLDHVPVIDEDDLRVDYLPVFHEAIRLGYELVMIDGSRLALEENIAAVRVVIDLAHAAGIPVEAELGAVFGHEEGPIPSYEVVASGKGFTDVAEAVMFVQNWLRLAFGGDWQRPRGGGGQPEGPKEDRGAPGLAQAGGFESRVYRFRWCCTAVRASSRTTCGRR